jgi:molybdopterin-guanine dinucleotide biosynthesis protein
MKVYRTLKDLNFDKIIAEAKGQTSTGSSMLSSFKAAVMRQPVTHALVNSFLNESKNYRYDNGVIEAATNVAKYINENQYSGQLATACEAIHASGSRYNSLNENAANQVENLIEMDENDVVNYVKAGALKNVMFVESFRRIARSIFRDMPVVEINENYTAVHPISVTETKEGSTFFSVLGHLFECKDGEIHETKWNAVSEDFRQMTALLNSRNAKVVNETVVYDCNGKFTYTISEQGKAVKETGENKFELTTEQLRENNSLYLSTLIPGRRNQVAGELEAVAKLCENFDNVTVLDNVSIFTTSKDRFVVAEHNGNAVAFLVESAKRGNAWTVTDNIANVVEFLKKQTSTDLTESYKEQIEKVVENRSEEEKAEMQRKIQEDGIEARKRKIAELTEQYKNDPARLMILAKLAEDLNQLN